MEAVWDEWVIGVSTAKFILGESGWAEPRHTSATHVDDILHSTLLPRINSSFCKAMEYWVWGEKKDQKSTLDCYHLALFSKLLRETWVIKAFISRYLGTVSRDYFLFLCLLPQYFPSSVDFSSSGGLFLSPRKLSLWNLLLNFATRISNSRKRKAN